MSYRCLCGQEFLTSLLLASHVRMKNKQEPGKHGGVSKKYKTVPDLVEDTLIELLAVPEMQRLAAKLISKALKRMGKYLT